jgi:guanylate kinase
MKKSNIFVISGPSGAGEDSVMNGLDKVFSTERVVTTTTRPMRSGESQGKPYYLISRNDFLDKISKGEIFEHVEQDNGNYYGVTKAEIERVSELKRVIFWRMEFNGVIKIKKILPDVITIMLDVPKEVIERRIRKRDNPSEDFLKIRLDYAQGWYENRDKFDYTVKNEDGKLQEAVDVIAEIIRKHNT